MMNLIRILKTTKIAVLLALVSFLSGCQPANESRQFEQLIGNQGCLIERITDEAYDEYQFQGVSSDGKWLSYAWSNGVDADNKPIRGSVKLNLLTGEKIELPESLNNVGSFSPDGARLVGAHYVENGKTDIIEYHQATGENTTVAQDSAWDWLPSYSPNGRFIVFNSYRPGNSELYLYDRKENALRRLTNNEVYDAHAEFSPDGKKVLFNRMISRRKEGGYNFDLIVYELSSGNEVKLTGSLYEESYGSWGPDNATLAFSSDFEQDPEKRNLYIRSPNGALNRLTNGDWEDSYSYWTRDGEYIYFNSNRSGNSDVYRIRMIGSDCAKAN